VFGISGVGKTSACETFIARHPEWLYVRASALMSEALTATPEALRTASAERITANQAVLGDRLHARRADQLDRPILVDVHGVIDNDRELVRVPLATVASLDPDGLILLEAPAHVVAARRQGDARARPRRTVPELIHEIAAEHEAVRAFAEALRLPLESASVSDDFRLDASVARLLTRIRQPRS
jgi:adenylate kinase